MSQGSTHIHSFIHSFIQELIKHPFKKSTQRRYKSVLSKLQNALSYKFRQEGNFQRESIPDGGTNNVECTMLPSCSCSMR